MVIVIITINVYNRDNFDHFTFDSTKYTPFYNDPRVIVSTSNLFEISKVDQHCSKCMNIFLD